MTILSPADRRKCRSTGMTYSVSAESCLFHLSVSFNAVKQQSWWSKAVSALAGGISINIHLRASIGKVRYSSCRCRILTSFPIALTSFLVFSPKLQPLTPSAVLEWQLPKQTPWGLAVLGPVLHLLKSRLPLTSAGVDYHRSHWLQWVRTDSNPLNCFTTRS